MPPLLYDLPGLGSRTPPGAHPATGRLDAGPPPLRPAARLPVHLAQRRGPPGPVAEWAGHSVDVLLRIYANCVDGDDQIALGRIDQALQ
ncbi:hypothetical protein GCM10023350_24890 [Nocardioides endophyticus]|uniref:Integrase n=1 Tax=Nocardioides endophyticus TaxID=1353775 RepID=A0ABP8YWA8_9ACTN